MDGFVNPGCAVNTRRIVSNHVEVRHSIRKPYPYNVETTNLTYPADVIGDFQKSAIVKTEKIAGWRPPTQFRMFAGKAEGKPFKYDVVWGYHTQHVSSERTSVANSEYGIANLLYWGTWVAGQRIPDVSQNLQNQAITECKLKLQSQKMDLLASLGESKKTFQTILDLAKRLALFVKRLKRGDFIGAWKALLSSHSVKKGKLVMTSKQSVSLFRRSQALSKGSNTLWKSQKSAYRRTKTYYLDRQSVTQMKGFSPADAWLQFQYGVMPLIWDMKGAIDAFEQGLRKGGAPIKAVRRLERNYGMPQHYSYDAVGKCDVGVEVKLYANIDNTYVDALNRLGLINLASSAWELMPYSFVIDWLAPIGDMIKAVSTRTGIVYKGGYIGTKTVSDFTVTRKGIKGYGWPDDDLKPKGTLPSARFSNVCYWRVPLNDMPLPGFYIKSPFSTKHTASALSLIANATRTR